MSNDDEQGCRNVGRSGWHIDGSFMDKPFKIQTMTFWSVSDGGNTLFSPLAELVESLPEAQRKEWEDLYFVGSGESGRQYHGKSYATAAYADLQPMCGAAILFSQLNYHRRALGCVHIIPTHARTHCQRATHTHTSNTLNCPPIHPTQTNTS